ncbi:pneumococcal-type histidine triad protein [Streptococcus sp. X16XC17]|uniref:pneumococcal-type histidine triad protein n=1 Tax=Streptococcus sp. X16XC17 TaxID=2316646 RepID=UPI0022A96344|nr:pneumococcal-type histidine triad protein [Streptococcus sp. X16XC17]
MDKPTDDGFLLTNESQIQSKIEDGIVVEHDGHSHFFFYNDLKGTKWEYLIPADKKTQANTAAKSTEPGHNSANHGGDGYVFNPDDIVSEDANGYMVRHGDHYHYIWKKDLVTNGASVVAPQNHQHGASTSSPNTNHHPNKPHKVQKPTGTNPTNTNKASDATKRDKDGKQQFPGVHYKTDDGFLFDGKHVIKTSDLGLMVAHNGNQDDIHVIPYSQLVNTKWEHFIPSKYLEEAKKTYQANEFEQPKTKNVISGTDFVKTQINFLQLLEN